MTKTPILKSTSPDRSIVHYGLSWQQFKLIQAGFGESRNIRLSYYDNTIEILMPGREHEFFKTIIGMLIELFCLENHIEFEPLGATTQEREPEVSLEPDESYCFGESKPQPDLAIEVIFSSGSARKLQRYRVLGIPEVWFWEDGVLSLYRLRDRDYEQIFRSEIPELATLDIDLFSRCILIAQTSRLEAANTFRNALENNPT
ncbi:MAG: Uma2 family endonuclease [Spirulina sp.]